MLSVDNCINHLVWMKERVCAGSKTWIDVEVEILPLVEPYLGKACVVMVNYF